MAIPSSFLDELRSRVSIADIAARYVTWDRSKTNIPKGDYWACCPFHHEKSPSFHVDERKGYFYCFGCHEKGSALDLAMQLGNQSFRDAVADLAETVGMAIPEDDPRERARAAKRLELSDAMEAAVEYYRQMLFSSAGVAAMDYLTKVRGLSQDAIARWQLGFAPEAWEALTPALTRLGFSLDQLVEAGLSKRSDKGRNPYDLFRNRIMFPIRDPRGRCIAFGGRAMSKDDPAKYLNSPTTPLFDKSRTLYNLGPAQTAAAKGAELIVAEGYMDVIALSEAGFEGAVAPLGTAMTEAHLQQLWKRVDAPVLALDGDVAGTRAAQRSADVALPHLTPGKSLRMAFLPGGQDPDDLLKSADGPQAMARLIEQAAPLVDMLWDRAVAAGRFETPEGRAAFEAALEALSARIENPMVRNHYKQVFKERRFQFFRELNRRDRPSGAPAGRGGGARRGSGRGSGRGPGGGFGGGFGGAAAGPRPETRATAMAVGAAGSDAAGPMRGRECVLIAALLHQPALLERAHSDLEALELLNPQLDAARGALLSALADGQSTGETLTPERLAGAVDARCGAGVSAALCVEIAGKLPRALMRDAAFEEAWDVFIHLLRFHASEVCWIRERTHYVEEVALLDGAPASDTPDRAADDGPSPMEHRLQDALTAARASAQSDQDEAAAPATRGNSTRLQSFVDAEPWKKRG